MPNRLLGWLSVLVVLVAAGLWWASGGGAPPLPAGATAGLGTMSGAAEPADGAGPLLPVRDAAPLPATVPGAAVAGAAASARTLVGTVVDDAGNGVAGAVVAARRGREGAFDPAAFDPAAFVDFDPAAFAERLRAAAGDRVESTTDVAGTFRVALPPGGSQLSLEVRARGHAILLQRVAIDAGTGDVDAGTLALRRAAIVSGRVVDRAGTGIVGALVRPDLRGGGPGALGGFSALLDQEAGLRQLADRADLGRMFGEQATTDADGRFELVHVSPATTSLRASHPDHPDARREGLQLRPGEVLADVTIVLDPGAVVRGRVLDLPPGIAGVQVVAAARTAPRGPRSGAAEAEAFAGMAADLLGEVGDLAGFGERTVEPDPDGAFELRGLRPGAGYRVFVTQRGRGFTANAVCSARLEVQAPVEGLELRYDPGLRVTFQVVDAVRGVPIETLWLGERLRGGGGVEAMMAMAPRPLRRGQHPDGRVVLTNLRPKPAQTLELRLEAIGYAPLRRTGVPLPASGELDLGVVQLMPAPALVVQVRTADSGEWIAGARIEVEAAEPPSGRDPMALLEGRIGGAGPRAGVTGGDGRCRVNAPPGGQLVVTATHAGHAPARSEPRPSPTGDDAVVDLVLAAGGTVVARVVDAAGAPLAQARVEHAPPFGPRATARADGEGVARFERLTPGEHHFRLGSGSRRGELGAMAMAFAGAPEPPSGPGWTRVQVADRAEVEIVLHRDPATSLRGVVRENGQPLAGVRVQLLPGDRAAGGESGERMIEDLMPGRERTGRTGADGSYELPSVPPGNHRLRVSGGGRAMPAVVAVTLAPGANVVDVDLDVAVVSGVVRGPDGAPRADAEVSVERAIGPGETPGADAGRLAFAAATMAAAAGGAASARTGADGRYQLRGLQTGVPLRVRAAAKGAAPAVSAALTLGAAEQRDGVDLQLAAAGRLRVTVAGDMPFGAITARLLDAAGQPRADVAPQMAALLGGSAMLDGLLPGAWRVTIEQPGAEVAPRTIVVVAGVEATLAF